MKRTELKVGEFYAVDARSGGNGGYGNRIQVELLAVDPPAERFKDWAIKVRLVEPEAANENRYRGKDLPLRTERVYSSAKPILWTWAEEERRLAGSAVAAELRRQRADAAQQVAVDLAARLGGIGFVVHHGDWTPPETEIGLRSDHNGTKVGLVTWDALDRLARMAELGRYYASLTAYDNDAADVFGLPRGEWS